MRIDIPIGEEIEKMKTYNVTMKVRVKANDENEAIMISRLAIASPFTGIVPIMVEKAEIDVEEVLEEVRE